MHRHPDALPRLAHPIQYLLHERALHVLLPRELADGLQVPVEVDALGVEGACQVVDRVAERIVLRDEVDEPGS